MFPPLLKSHLALLI